MNLRDRICLVTDARSDGAIDLRVARVGGRHSELGGNLLEIVVVEPVTAFHQRIVRPPEIAARGE